MKNNNVGIIGFGKIGQIREKYLRKNNIFPELIYEPDENVFIKKNKRAKTPEEIIENKNINIIFVCTPNSFNKL